MKYLLIFAVLLGCEQQSKVVERQRIIQEIEVPVEKPDGPSTPLPPAIDGFVSVARMTQAMNNFVEGFPRSVQQNIAFINGCNRSNEADDPKKTNKETQDGVNKMLNYIAGQNINRATKAIDLGPEAPCAFAYNLKDYGITALEYYWDIEEELMFDFAPQGDREQLLRFFTQKRRPWINANEFALVAMSSDATTRNNGSYYKLTDQNIDDYDTFLASRGIDLNEAVNQREIAMAGTSGSLIARQKTRLIYIVPQSGRRGYCAFTGDTDSATEDNVIENFAIPEILRIDGDNRISPDLLFKANAFEVICTKSNGLFADFSLRAVNNFVAGVPEGVAPATVVVNEGFTETDSQISIGADCARCHRGGAIVVKDEVNLSIQDNPLIIGDTKKAVALMFSATRLSGYFEDINREHNQTLVELDIDPEGPDPITEYLAYPLRRESNIKQVAGYFQIKTEDFRRKLLGAAGSRTILSNLLIESGEGKVSRATLVRSFPIVVEEMQLFKDPEDF